LAYWLACYGFEPTLVEHAPRLRKGGYVIDFWGLGYDIAEKMRLLRDLNRRAYRVQELRFVDDGGRRVGGFGVDVFRKMTGGRRYISLRRSDLGEAIYRTIENRCEIIFCEIIFDDTVADVENTRDGVAVEFERAPLRMFDRWSCGRVALVGDSAFAPSLLAGQGSALAMTAAYVLAGELAIAEGQYEWARAL
jgi:2-polyprenyl-6-methoxyphenol hydroxylase-like FAD-dependent oxidoreductase